ncbi:hypothetical protein AB0J83_41435 [Actinoplanes sp. NPDC049596]|uniref:hypothetical protein n=1 Tax=unclassified Actinoplanes TaxID=2626549 RepID=UPI003443AEB0
MATIQGQIVGTKVGSTVKVRIRGGKTVVTAEVARDLTVANNDLVNMDRVSNKYYVAYRVRTAAALPPPTESPSEPTPKPELITGTDTFSPIETRTWNTNKWRMDTSDLFQGTETGLAHTGVVFFGDQLKSLKDATITNARLTGIARIPYAGTYTSAASTIWLVTQNKRPSGAPTRTSSIAGPALTVGAILPSFDIPNSWVDDMADGDAGGLAFYDADGSPDIRYAGMGSYPEAMQLIVEWERLSS